MKCCLIFGFVIYTFGVVSSLYAGDVHGDVHPGELQNIRIVTSEFAPFNYLENGEPKGFCTEIVQAVLKELDLAVPITTLPWARAYQLALRQENTLIYTIARTPEREALFQWVGILVIGESYLFALKSRGIRLGSLDQARPYRIGVARNGIRARFLQSKGILDLDQVVNSRMNAVKLLNQRIDLWAEDELAAAHTIRQLGYEPDDILSKAFHLDLGMTPKGFLAFSLKTDPGLVSAFSETLEGLVKSKVYENLKKKYGITDP